MSEGVCFVLTVMLTVCFGELPVKEYVYPKILQARGANGEKMLHIRDGLTLSLEKSKVFAGNFSFTKGDDVNDSNSSLNVKEIEESLYQDRKHGSSVVVQESNGYVQVTGILTDTLSIEPVLSNQRSKDGIVAHLISKLNDSSIPMYADYVHYTHLAEREARGDIHRAHYWQPRGGSSDASPLRGKTRAAKKAEVEKINRKLKANIAQIIRQAEVYAEKWEAKL
ncbi:uncharacterized protein LOC121837907 [Ixodes scapularis]|uniref:uncharacterized protein LOC121837907 n=1 Tax=Ixodes scapularis TaxID=6945 RepID=UPI001C391D91|nr:uncharacterized protein LOC121837907 [Ixodes scapularis]